MDKIILELERKVRGAVRRGDWERATMAMDLLERAYRLESEWHGPPSADDVDYELAEPVAQAPTPRPAMVRVSPAETLLMGGGSGGGEYINLDQRGDR